jgi:hypothetical protein
MFCYLKKKKVLKSVNSRIFEQLGYQGRLRQFHGQAHKI